MLRRLHPYCRLFCIALFGILMGALASGCMWGVVRDADTGKPLAGVTITLTDTQGQTLTTTSDANGLFGFGAPVSAAPARGPVNFQVNSPGYQSITETRDVLYDDNPNASFQNMQSFWDVQIFNLDRGPGGYYSEKGKFGVTYPADWTVKPVEDVGENMAAVRGAAPSSSSDYPASCFIMSGPLPAAIPLDTIMDSVLNQVKGLANVSMFQKQEVKSVQLNGLSAVRAIFSYKMTYTEGSQKATYNLKTLMYLVAKNDKMYEMVCETFIEKFPGALPTFEKIAQSFRAD